MHFLNTDLALHTGILNAGNVLHAKKKLENLVWKTFSYRNL